MDSYWIPAVNNLHAYGRWAFAELTDIYQIESELASRIESQFKQMIDRAIGPVAPNI